MKTRLLPGVLVLITTTASPVIGAESFFPSELLPPPEGVYLSTTPGSVTFPSGLALRDLRLRGFTQSFLPPPFGLPRSDSFDARMDLELSTDGGLTFTPANGACNVSESITRAPDVGARRIYSTEMLGLSISGGTLPPGLLIRESPTIASTGQTTLRSVAGGFMADSFFDVWFEVSADGGATWSPAAEPAHLEGRPDPAPIPPVPTPSRLVLPPLDLQLSTNVPFVALSGDFAFKAVRQTLFTPSIEPPAPGRSSMLVCDSQTDFQWSSDGGTTWHIARSPGRMELTITRLGWGGDEIYDAEVTGWSISGGDLPPGVLIRESPTEPSRGLLRISGGGGGGGACNVQSFFDIWIEVSADGGQTWMPASSGPGHLELHSVAHEASFASPNLQPANGEYFNTNSSFAQFASGVLVKEVVLRRFTQGIQPPPPGMTVTHTCSALVDCLLSTDGGATFNPTTAPAALTFRLASLVDSGTARYFDTEMLALDIAGGGLPPGAMIRESPTRASLGRTSIRSLVTTEYMIESFFDVFIDLSLDGGQSWSPTTIGPGTLVLRAGVIPPLAITCPSDLWLLATGPLGAIVNYPSPTVDGGCPPVTLTCDPPSGTPFPVGTTPVNCTANDSCGQSARCSFQVTVRPYQPPPEVFFGSDLLPPSQGVFISLGQLHAVYANGVMIRDLRYRRFTQSFPPPAPGAPETHSCDAVVEYEISPDGGQTFMPASAPATATVLIAHTATAGGTRFFDTEMLALEIGGGGGAVMIRESPTRQSLGRTTLQTVTGGYLIESFFDVWTEVSLDGGATWAPALDGGPIELRSDPLLVPPVQVPTVLLPPLNEVYVSRAQWSGTYAAGVILRDLRQKFFTQAALPPQPGGSLIQHFDSQVDFQISTDGGMTFQHARAPAGADLRFVALVSSDSGFYDTEVLSLDVSGGDLPPGVLLRESPTLPSTGVTEIRTLADGTYRVTSFFDVFTELSMDGGQTWMPVSSEPARMELQAVAEEDLFPTSTLLPLSGGYFSSPSSSATFAPGVVVKDVVHRQFDQSFPLPAPGASAVHSCGSLMDFMVSMDGGATFTPTTAPAALTFRITSLVDSGTTRYFDTEMLALDIAGGGLPAGVLIRESPTRSSLGRSSLRSLVTMESMIDSFFDVFTELSTDGGQTWSPARDGHVTLILRAAPCVTIDCPPDIVVDATGPGGAVVPYTVTARDRCGGQPVVTSNPPSGSLFPIGTTTVQCQASSANGTATCSFTVTVYNNEPVAVFTALPNPAPCGQVVSFDASSSSHGRPDRKIVKYEWDFGDGTTGTGQQVTRAFSAFASYGVVLTVTDNNVPPKTDTASVTVEVNQGNRPPVAVAGGPYVADLGSGLTLDGSGSSDPNEGCGDSIAKYAWDIAGGTHVLSGVSPSLSPAEVNGLGVGRFPVVLTVTDEFGATGSASTTLDIYDNRPFAVFTANPNPAGCGQVVSFDASSSSHGRPDRSIVKYEWDFGDATVGTGQQVTHAFSAFGSYTITLTVTDNNMPAKTDIESITLPVNQGNRAPVAAAGGPYTIALGDSLLLDGSASSDPDAGCGDWITRYEWDLNLDGTYDLTGSPLVVPPATLSSYGLGNPGDYSLRLQVTDTFGLTHSGLAQLTVWLPRLQYRTSPGRLTVFWPRAVEGFRLQATDTLVNPQWQPVPVNPSGDEYTADLDSTTGMRFLRLVK